jgi:hypothetical protein
MAKWERHAPLAGVLAVVLWVVGLILIGETEDKPAEILAQVRSDDDRILIGTIIFLLGTALFVWFLGSLRVRLLAAEGPAARLTAIAFAGGVATAVFLAGLPSTTAAAALSKDDIDASAASAMVNLADGFFLGAEYMAPVMLAAFAIVSLRYGAFPKWLAWLSFLIALVMVIAPIGWAALIFAFPIWTLIVSVLMWMGAERPAPTGQPVTGATG